MANKEIKDFTTTAALSTDLFLKQSGGGTTENSTGAQISTLVAPLTTKGDLLANNGANNVRIPVGTNGQVLIADSSQVEGVIWAPQWTIFDCTVGSSGANYTTVAAAILAGCTNILVISSVTETSNPSLTVSNYYIQIKDGETWNLDTFENQPAANDINIQVRGGIIATAYSVPGSHAFDCAGFTGCTVDLERVTIDQSAVTANDCYIVENANLVASEIGMTLPNQDNCGINVPGSFIFGFLNHILFQGGGAACERVLVGTNGQVKATDINFSGTFIAAGSGDVIDLGGTTNQILGLGALNFVATIDTSLSGTIIGINNLVGQSMNVKIAEDGTNFDACNLGAGNLDFQDKENCTIAKFTTTGSVDLTDIGANNNKITQSRFTSMAGNVGGNRNKISDSEILTGFAVDGDRNQYIGVQIGADGGGGADTLTINASASQTRFLGEVDADIVDNSGTADSILDYTIF